MDLRKILPGGGVCWDPAAVDTGRVRRDSVQGAPEEAKATIVAVLASRRSAPAAVSSDRPSDSPVAARYTSDLRQLLPARPATSQLVRDPISADGTLSLDQAAQITHPEADAKRQLQAYGYQTGAIAQWQDGDALVTIWLFQFDSARNTHGYQDALDETFAPGFFDQMATPAGLTGGHVYVSKRALDERGILATATAVRGSLLVIVTRYQPTPDIAAITDLAASQYARLPA